MTGSEFYLKSEQEMRQIFSWCPEAIENTIEVANKCNYELDWTHMYLPKFPDLQRGRPQRNALEKSVSLVLQDVMEMIGKTLSSTRLTLKTVLSMNMTSSAKRALQITS